MKQSPRKIIEALQKNGGYVSQTARALGIKPTTIYKHIERHAEVRQAWMDIKDMYLDLAESKVVAALNASKPWAICFYLKCQGKDRGWIETSRHELTGNNGGPVQVQDDRPDYTKLTKDELHTLRTLHAKVYDKADTEKG